MFSPNKEPLRISDHAVLRYLERAMNLNVDIVREHIASICASPAAFGANCVRAEGLRFEISMNTVTTVRPDGQAPSLTSRNKAQDKIKAGIRL
jgi:hypothetical protein